ncbi:hypothetical protein GALMADRAFT_111471 [Galerina marginata CBS 339.88]|uniref:NACHT domain-containing protein n=1 Tax=Galerina marginata (strain CBS 339.88) TaxID=685588 RepID=A0A067TWA6_GALM3|nr:hypothetical protein GALMADRAFT_111471 [Galerina marginata CBS 339.88]
MSARGESVTKRDQTSDILRFLEGCEGTWESPRMCRGPARPLPNWFLTMYHNSNILIAGGTANYVAGDFVQSNGQGLRRLEEHVSAGALHNSGEVSDQPKCHPGTRVAILQHLLAWATALTYTYPIIWLHGPAGSGKSSILRAIAQMLSDQGLLIASFFFFRSAGSRNSSEHFIATLAYQLAISIPTTRPYIEEAIESNPLIFSLSLWDQARAFLISPIHAVYCNNPDDFNPRVIIVDGLDECRDPEKQCEILRVLCYVLEHLPIPLAVLIASRPEHHIRGEFLAGDLNKYTSRLSLDNSYNPDADIKTYLEDKFSEIQQRHRRYLPTSPWPSQEVIDNLVAKASGQFIYASTIVKFVNSPRHSPTKRLDIILGSINAEGLKPFEQLDILYSTIFLNIHENDQSDVLRVLGVLLVPFSPGAGGDNARTPTFLERLLNLEAGDIRHLLFDLESLLTIGSDDEPIRFFHASLGDYLFDSSRSGQFWIDAGRVYADLAHYSMIHLTESKDWIELKQLFYENSFLFFSKAAPTPGLQNAIESCDMTKISDFSVWAPASGTLITDITPTFLQAIRDSKFPDANDLYRQKRTSYAKIIRPRIQIYFQDIRLTRLLVAATATEVEDHDFKGKRDHYYSLRSILQVPDEMWNVQKRKGLCLANPSLALMQVIKELLDDNAHALGVGYFVNESHYADAALCFIKFMTQKPAVALAQNDCKVTSAMDMVQGNLSERQTTGYMTNILPVLLSKSPIRQELLVCIKNAPLHPYYSEFSSIKNALKAYILQSETRLTNDDNPHTKSLYQDSYKPISGADRSDRLNPWYLRWKPFRWVRRSVTSKSGSQKWHPHRN